METIVEQLSATHKHPVIVALGRRGDIAQTFILVEGQAISVTRGLVNAVDRMLKLYFVMNMEYPIECKHVLHFLQRSIMELQDEFTMARSGSDLTLFLRQKLKR